MIIILHLFLTNEEGDGFGSLFIAHGDVKEVVCARVIDSNNAQLIKGC